MERSSSQGRTASSPSAKGGKSKSRERVNSTISNHSERQHLSHPISGLAHADNALGAPMAFDSASVIGTDLIYRLDDAKREAQGLSEEGNLNSAPATSDTTSGSQTNGTNRDGASQSYNDEEPEEYEEEDSQQAWLKGKPWWKRPSEMWLRPCAIVLAMTSGMAMAPRAELYLQIVCEEVLPREAVPLGSANAFLLFNTTSLLQSPIHLESAIYSHQQEKAANDYSLIFSNLLTPSIAPSHLRLSIDKDTNSPSNSSTTQPPEIPGQTPPSRAEQCRKSSLVVSLSTALQLKLTLATGILGVILTGFWTTLSDRYGRIRILALGILGMVFTDCIDIFVAKGGHLFGLGSSLLIIGSAVQGLLGGFSTIIAAHQAYLADTSPTGSSRAALFTKFAGFMFLGFMCGPFLGGLLVKKTHDLTSAFWIAGGSHFLYFLFAALLLPESLSPQKQMEARREHEELKKARKAKAREGDEESASRQERSLSRNRTPRSSFSHVRRAIRKILAHDVFTPLHPMAMLLPRKVQPEETDHFLAHGLGRWAGETSSRTASMRGRRGDVPPEEEPLLPNVEGEQEYGTADLENGKAHSSKGKVPSSSHISVSYVPELHPVPPSPHPLYSSNLPPRVPTKSRPRDWNLFFLSLAYGVDNACYGVLSAKTLYSQHKFDWGPSQIGAFLSLAAFSRVVALTLVLPIGVAYFHKPVKKEVLDDAKDETLSPSNFRPQSSHRRQSRGPGEARSGASDQDSVDSVESDRPQSNAEKELSALWAQRAHHVKMLHDSSFDLNLARFSIFWMFICYAAMSLGQGPIVFIVATALSSLGGGGGAAMASLALNFLRKDTDAAKLLGAWAIMTGLCGSILGPILFSMTFVRTVDVLPESVFILGSAFFLTSFALLLLVKIRPPNSLPALPPPVSSTTEELAATLKTPTKSSKNRPSTASASASGTVKSTASGPEESTRSKFRLRPSAREVFGDQPASSKSHKTNTADDLVDTTG